MVPAKEVGGDLYDFFLIDKYRLGVVIADVSGKGIASALLMAVCKTLLKATSGKGMPSDNVLYEVNNILADETPSNMFVTLFYGVLDTRSGAFEYSNAGHNIPLLISADGNAVRIKNIGGVLLGVVKDAEYQSNIIMLEPGSTLFFYTDGVTEAFNKNKEEFGEERLLQILSDKNNLIAADFVHRVFEDVQSFSEGVEQNDDITCLALKYTKK
jgi:sigma-B regulation protein RsbU (phosphoserine phosphatase)